MHIYHSNPGITWAGLLLPLTRNSSLKKHTHAKQACFSDARMCSSQGRPLSRDLMLINTSSLQKSFGSRILNFRAFVLEMKLRSIFGGGGLLFILTVCRLLTFIPPTLRMGLRFTRTYRDIYTCFPSSGPSCRVEGSLGRF